MRRSTIFVWTRFHKHTYKRSRNAGLVLLLRINDRCRCGKLDWDDVPNCEDVPNFFIFDLSIFISAQI